MPAIATTNSIATDRVWLEGLRHRYHHRRYLGTDPLEFLFAYDDPRDREVVGLVASSLAYGNVKAMRPAIARVLETLGPAPAERVRCARAGTLARRLRGFRYRFTTGAQMAGLLVAAGRLLHEQGSLAEPVADHVPDGDAAPALAALAGALAGASPCPLTHLVPHPSGGSACKRLNLFLRWMVRRDAVDPGTWPAPAPSALLVPLDTHVHRAALGRGWTRRRSADLRTVLEVTAALRAIRPDDPLRYDFALTRPGILGLGAPAA